MINGVHAIIFSDDAEGVRTFFRDVLELPSVDAGGGWLIFALPPAELAAHPDGDESGHELYLMCDDIGATVEELKAKGVEFTREISDAGFGLVTALRLPDGGELAILRATTPEPAFTRALNPGIRTKQDRATSPRGAVLGWSSGEAPGWVTCAMGGRMSP